MRALSIVFVFFIFIFSWAGIAGKNTAALHPEKYQLKNGMRVLLLPDSKIPLYTLHILYQVGSKDEDPQLTGLAHFFEHLMFKGSKNYPDGRFDSLIEENGGQNNAFTTRDYTAYHEDMPTGTLKEILKVEADRMRGLQVTQKNVTSEREVVKEERRMRVENSPFGAGFEKLMQMSYTPESSYSWPIIGSMKHLEKASLQDFKSFYQKYYSPNNAILVLAGDFKVKKAKFWIQKYFAPLENTKFVRKTTESKADIKFKKKRILKKISSPLLMYAGPGFSVYAPEAKALDLISFILAGDKSSRLHKELVEKQGLLSSVSAWNYTPKKQGLLMFFATVKNKKNRYKAQKEIKKLINKARREGFTQEELRRAKKLLEVSHYASLQKLSGRARSLALYEFLYGDYNVLNQEIDKYEKITLKELNALSKKYLKIDSFNQVEVL